MRPENGNIEKESPRCRRDSRRGDTSRKVLNVMSLFTGVESLGILCSIVKNKLVALWIGAVGIGYMSILNSTIETATYLTGLGIRQSAVRDVSAAAHEGGGRLRRVVMQVRAWSVVAGMLGAVALAGLAWPLAELIFEDGSLWWNFMVLGGAMLLNALYGGESAIFQGTEQFRRLARAGAWGGLTGLLLSVPLFRFMGSDGISWSILAYSISILLFAVLNRDKAYDSAGPQTAALSEGKGFVKFGAWISVTAFINSGCQLIFASWLSRTASVATVGLYAAGMTLVVRYTSLFFNSVGFEYYPRVSGSAGSRQRTSIFMNHEVTLLLLLFTPMTLLFLIFKDLLIRFLYDSTFMEILPFVTFGIMQVIFRGVSNTMAYTIMAKGEGKIYLLTDSTDALLGLGLSILFYRLMGLTGIGLALVIWHFCYMMVVGVICHWRYGLKLSKATRVTVIISILTGALGVAASLTLPSILYIPLLALASAVYIRVFYLFLRSRRSLRAPFTQLRQ